MPISTLSDLLIADEKEKNNVQSEQLAEMINSSATNTLVLLDNLLNWAKSHSK